MYCCAIVYKKSICTCTAKFICHSRTRNNFCLKIVPREFHLQHWCRIKVCEMCCWRSIENVICKMGMNLQTIDWNWKKNWPHRNQYIQIYNNVFMIWTYVLNICCRNVMLQRSNSWLKYTLNSIGSVLNTSSSTWLGTCLLMQ